MVSRGDDGGKLRRRALARMHAATPAEDHAVILVDTSLWVEQLRRGHPGLATRLEEADVATHPFVIGELACGSLKNRREVLDLMAALPHASVADHGEVSRYLIAGPSLWWDKGMILKAEAAAAESGKTLHGRAFLSVGADEGESTVAPLKNLTAAPSSHGYPIFNWRATSSTAKTMSRSCRRRSAGG